MQEVSASVVVGNGFAGGLCSERPICSIRKVKDLKPSFVATGIAAAGPVVSSDWDGCVGHMRVGDVESKASTLVN